MKYLLLLAFIFLTFSQFKCQEIEDNEDFETEEVDPIDTNEEESESESVLDLDLIPSFKTPINKSKGKKKEDPADTDSDQTPLTSFVSTLEKGTTGILGKIGQRFTSRVQEFGSQFQETQQRLNKRLQNRVNDFMEGIQHQIEG